MWFFSAQRWMCRYYVCEAPEYLSFATAQKSASENYVAHVGAVSSKWLLSLAKKLNRSFFFLFRQKISVEFAAGIRQTKYQRACFFFEHQASIQIATLFQALIVNVIETFFDPDPLLLNLLSDASNFLVILNSSVNCVIYFVFNKEYREIFL